MKLVSPANHGSRVKHRLDPERIIETAENLAKRIGQRMPGSGLSSLAMELAGIARATDQRALEARRPILAIRFASATAIGLSLLGLWYLVDDIHARWEFGTITEVFEATDAGFNLLVILAGALWFLITLESRLKRKRALGSIEELREFIHVIDLTQLYYTPELYKPDDTISQNAWGFDYTYLLFCTQMIRVISNLAALYTRGAADDSVLRAASDVEMLTNAVTSKLLSKVETVRRSSASK
jgi:hypothetical protein